ncbi:MAG: DegT/DnrJ/EryC1/StrS family aminotransferase [Planctomycetes bacterium]|nr:DegT/DnrJ/EryC1/StrS family aminotransferase [Planctomycetota bacterium]
MIPVFDYLEQHAALEDEILAAAKRVFASGRLMLGSELAAFETGFANWLGCDGHGAVGVANGTDALEVCLRALNVGAGDEVITVANTAVPTVSAIRRAGATPVLCDVDPHTALMDLEQVPALLTDRTRAVIPVHLYGNAVNVPRLVAQVEPRGVAVVEDCAQSHGARFEGRMTGTMGDAAAFSFYPTKNLGAYGDGGLCIARDDEIADRMRRIRMYGFDGAPIALLDGVNSRLDEVQAAILSVKLPHLASWVERRRALAQRYLAQLPDGAVPFATDPRAQHAYHLFVVQVDDRDGVRARLLERGVGTGVHYPAAIHRMPAYRDLDAPDLPHTEALTERVLSLPLYPELREESVDHVVHALAEAL